MATSDLTSAYRACARTTRREARNFYFAFLSLPPAQRSAVYALYAFCREADDIADADRPAAARRAELAALRRRLADAAGGSPGTRADLALSDAIRRFGIDPSDLGEVLTGVESDLEPREIESVDELTVYCYRVASAVGLATLPILTGGVPPSDAQRRCAVDLGLGMQLVNILRDVVEDLDRGRIYLPREERERFGVRREDLERRALIEPVRRLLAATADRAAERLASGGGLVPLLPPRSRACPWLLGAIYGRILERIRRRSFDVFAGRVSLPTIEKLWLLATAPWRGR